MGRNTKDEARRAFAALDTWVSEVAELIEATPSDILETTTILRRLDLTIRTGDALNIAIAMRLDATLATFDEKMAGNARALGAAVAAA
jgi:predicted nucleic acid-binding protein